MSLDFNRIDYNMLKNDPNIGLEIAKEIEKISWRKSPFEFLVGYTQDRALRTYKVDTNKPYRPRIKTILTGEGVRGNTDFETNYDNLEILSTTIYSDVWGNSVVSEIKQYRDMKNIDFIKEATDSLGDWMQLKRDRFIATALFNDLTNAFVADAKDIYKKGTKDTTVKEVMKKVKKDDVMSLKLLQRVVASARSGVAFNGTSSFPMKPTKISMKNLNGHSVEMYHYVILLDTHQANQLREDKDFQRLQELDKRGLDNIAFTGLLGMVNGTMIIEMDPWTQTTAGLLGTDIKDKEYFNHIHAPNFKEVTPPSQYAGEVEASVGYLLGGSAVLLVGANNPTFYIADEDAGRKDVVGVDRLIGIGKARYESRDPNNLLHGKDIGVIGIVSAR